MVKEQGSVKLQTDHKTEKQRKHSWRNSWLTPPTAKTRNTCKVKSSNNGGSNHQDTVKVNNKQSISPGTSVTLLGAISTWTALISSLVRSGAHHRACGPSVGSAWGVLREFDHLNRSYLSLCPVSALSPIKRPWTNCSVFFISSLGAPSGAWLAFLRSAFCHKCLSFLSIIIKVLFKIHPSDICNFHSLSNRTRSRS